MALTLVTKISFRGDAADLLKQASRGLRNPREFLKQVGVLGMNSAVSRLSTVLRQDQEGVRTGRLGASLHAGIGGGADTVFELSDSRVEVGSNVPYAAQVHYGGTILPKDAKALAIPLDKSLKLSGLSPRDLDPDRTLLRFIPLAKTKPNVIGVLVDAGPESEDGTKSKTGNTPYGPGVLYAIAYWVTQTPRPFLFWSDEDAAEAQRLFRKWIGWAA